MDLPKGKHIRDRCVEEGDCLLWTQAITGGGYARMSWKGKSVAAHIVAWNIVNGAVPDGKMLGNKCGHKHCCNPSHWEPITPSERNLRAAAAGAWNMPQRIIQITRTARTRGKLTEALAAEIRASKDEGTALARRLGVSKTAIYLVRAQKTWLTAMPNSSVFAPRR